MRARRIPQRTCVGCQSVKGKRELIRIVRDPEGNVKVDLSGKASGRGAYVCPQLACLEQAVKARRLERALSCSIPAEVFDLLRTQLAESRPEPADRSVSKG